MQIKFEGQSHQIDSNTLINALIHYNTIITEANRELSGGSKSVSVKVNAIEKGSFVIDIGLQENLMKSVFSAEGVAYLSGMVGIIGGVFALYKEFNGKPVNDDKISIGIKGNKNTVHIHNVYNTPTVREAISKSIETANEDTSVEGITISGEEIQPVFFDKSEFGKLIYTDFDKEKYRPEEQIKVTCAVLTIVALSFEKGAKWQFIYDGFKISMIVKDDALMRHIDRGARFAKGDVIRVKMNIVQKYNTEYKAYENKSYRIIEFIEHIEVPKQAELFGQ